MKAARPFDRILGERVAAMNEVEFSDEQTVPMDAIANGLSGLKITN